MEAAVENFARRELQENRQQPIRAGARLDELCALFRIGPAAARRTFRSMLAMEPSGSLPGVYSRAAIADWLTMENGRPIHYPEGPLLMEVDAVLALIELGRPLTSASLRTYRTKDYEHFGPSHVKVGRAIRYQLSDLVEWAQRYSKRNESC